MITKVLNLDEFAIRRGARENVLENLARLAAAAEVLQRGAADIDGNGEALRSATDSALLALADVKRSLMLLEAFATGQATQVGNRWEIAESLQEQRIGDLVQLLERVDEGT